MLKYQRPSGALGRIDGLVERANCVPIGSQSLPVSSSGREHFRVVKVARLFLRRTLWNEITAGPLRPRPVSLCIVLSVLEMTGYLPTPLTRGVLLLEGLSELSRGLRPEWTLRPC